MNELTSNDNVVARFITSTAGALKSEFQEMFKNLRRPHYTMRDGMDYYDGRLWYSTTIGFRNIKSKDGKERNVPVSGWITSGNALTKTLPAGVVSNMAVLPAPFSHQAVDAYLRGESVDGRAVIEGLIGLFKKYAKFRHDSTYSMLAHWAAGTWMYMAFPTYSYIRFTSIKPSSGKTTAMDMVGAVSFGHPKPWNAVTSATVYRTVDQTASVLSVDEFEKVDNDARTVLLQVFNAGYRKGAMVPRCNAEIGNKVETFHAYCPKLYAGLSGVEETLASRSLQITMYKKRKRDNILPFFPETDTQLAAELAGYRDALAIWALTNARACSDLVQERRKDILPPWLDDRSADIMWPLFAVAAVAGTDRAPLEEFCKTQTKVRDGAEQDRLSYHIIECLQEWYPMDQEVGRIHLETIRGLLEKTKDTRVDETKTIGDVLRQLELTVKQVRAGQDNKNRWGVDITRKELEELVEQL